MYKIICLNNFTLSGIFEVFDSILCNNIFINYGGYENEEIASKFFAGGGGPRQPLAASFLQAHWSSGS